MVYICKHCGKEIKRKYIISFEKIMWIHTGNVTPTNNGIYCDVDSYTNHSFAEPKLNNILPCINCGKEIYQDDYGDWFHKHNRNKQCIIISEDISVAEPIAINCKICGFDKDRPRGHIFVRNAIEGRFIEDVRCKECDKVTDWTRGIGNSARIIYRNFTGCQEYFANLKIKLIEQGYIIEEKNKKSKDSLTELWDNEYDERWNEEGKTNNKGAGMCIKLPATLKKITLIDKKGEYKPQKKPNCITCEKKGKITGNYVFCNYWGRNIENGTQRECTAEKQAEKNILGKVMFKPIHDEELIKVFHICLKRNGKITNALIELIDQARNDGWKRAENYHGL